MNEVFNNIYKRKSVRKFLEEQIPDEDIKTIIEAGIQAPSGHNAQPVYYTIVQNKEIIDHMNQKAKEEMQKSNVDWIKKFGTSERYHLLHNAPTVVVVSTKDDCYSPIEDSSAAIENMLLAAESLGIGSVWIGLINFYFALHEAKEVLKIKDGYKARYAVSFGYPDPEKTFGKPKRDLDVYEWIK